jgi:hypothetical protein
MVRFRGGGGRTGARVAPAGCGQGSDVAFARLRGLLQDREGALLGIEEADLERLLLRPLTVGGEAEEVSEKHDEYLYGDPRT